MMTGRLTFTCWGGPACGLDLVFDAENPPPNPTVYVILPLTKGSMGVYFERPKTKSACYILGAPRENLARYQP